MIKLIKSTFYKEKETKKKLTAFLEKAEILSMGSECRQFEELFSKKQETKHAVFVSNGSAANLILIQAVLNLGYLKKGDTVALSSVTWATNVMPIIQLGLKPLLLDCELDTLNVSSKILKEAYTKNPSIKGLFLTNVLGFSSDIEEIARFCKKNKIVFLEDNCESLGSKTKGTLLGNFGLASTFSFFVGHHFSTIEGGMVCTKDTKLRDMLVIVRAHGWDRNLEAKVQKSLRVKHGIDPFFSKYTFYDLAYNVRPTEINGFLGKVQMPFWDAIVATREKNYNAFVKALRGNPEVILPRSNHMSIVSNFAFPLICKNKETWEKYKKRFEDAHVEIRPIISGNIQRQPFFKKYVKKFTPCGNADLVHKHGFYFGNNPDMTKKEIETICHLLRYE